MKRVFLTQEMLDVVTKYDNIVHLKYHKKDSIAHLPILRPWPRGRYLDRSFSCVKNKNEKDNVSGSVRLFEYFICKKSL